MKRSWCILFLFITQLAFAQAGKADFFSIDQRAKYIEAGNAQQLAQKLSEPYTTDLQKVRSIFSWITTHIAYRVRKNTVSFRHAPKYKKAEVEDVVDTGDLKPLNERVADNVIREKVAVCNGYARLFKTLCDYAGLSSEIITGYARSDRNRVGDQFRANHNWNAVRIDSVWYLVDVTWAAGYVSFANDFIQSLDEYYFLTPPQQFIRDHYPENLQWTLLNHPPTIEEFRSTPFKHTAFIKYNISSYTPARGIIEASIGDSIRIELEMKDTEMPLPIAEDAISDTTWQLHTSLMAYALPAENKWEKKVHYSIKVESTAKEWLNIVYNDEIIMMYKLNIKENKEQ